MTDRNLFLISFSIFFTFFRNVANQNGYTFVPIFVLIILNVFTNKDMITRHPLKKIKSVM